LLLKGILHPDDARQALEAGVDGIVVSNHGARQLDRAPASLEALPAIRSVVGSRAVLLLDGGVRRGADILIALALGADFVLVGRSILFGLIAGGRPGAARAIDILATELSLTMAQAGMTSIVEVRADSHSSRQVQMARRSGDGDSECISSMLCK
jgi:isopentenyl diphosphate isomerase/L-lactate dehydrogenase-like FMN-dependent dehydrogenase